MENSGKRETLAIVGTVGLPANYGGWETLVENIVVPLGNEFDITVFCSAKRYMAQKPSYLDIKLEYIDLDANGIQSIPYDIVSLWRSRKFDRVLILGTSGCIALPFFRIISKARYFLNIDGLEWKRQKWSAFAKTYLRISEYFGCYSAQELVADNKVIQEHIHATYKKQSTLIAYGGNQPSQQNETKIVKPLAANRPFCFSVCRIEPENNSHILLEAFSEIPSKRLVFVGNWDASDYGRKLRTKFDHVENIQMLDPIYDRSELDRYRAHCEVYLHGHSAGGTNPSLVEAMSLGLPVMSYDVNFNRETTENKALYFRNTEELTSLLINESLVDLKSIAKEMKEVADRRYTWEIVSKQYIELLK